MPEIVGHKAKRILYTQYTNPGGYPPLEHSSRILAKAGWQVLFLGTGARGSHAVRFPPYPNIQVQQMTFCPPGWRQKLHYGQYCLWVLVWVARWRPQWIYASDLMATPLAWLLSYWPGLKVLYHEHDAPNEVRPSWFIRIFLLTRRLAAGRIQICVAPNAVRLRRLVETLPIKGRALCVWNCPAVEEVAARREFEEAAEVWLLYCGSIVPSRLPSTVLDALALLPERFKLRIIGYETVGHPNYVGELLDRANLLGLGKRVDYLGSMPRAELFGWAAQSHVGLTLMPNASHDFNEQQMTGASNKPFDYLAAGMALLVADLPEWREMYVTPGYAVTCNPEDADSIAQALQCLTANGVKLTEMGEGGRQRIATDWNYEMQFAPVLAALS